MKILVSIYAITLNQFTQNENITIVFIQNYWILLKSNIFVDDEMEQIESEIKEKEEMKDFVENKRKQSLNNLFKMCIVLFFIWNILSTLNIVEPKIFNSFIKGFL